jgi:hypothetical protein
MADEKKQNVKQEKNSKLLEIYLKKQEENDRKTEYTSVKRGHV